MNERIRVAKDFDGLWRWEATDPYGRKHTTAIGGRALSRRGAIRLAERALRRKAAAIELSLLEACFETVWEDVQ